jgi:uncharacterized protein (TIGR03435 family)
MRYLTLLAGAFLAVGVFVIGAPRPQAQTFTAPAGGVDAPDPNVPLFFEAASVKPSDPKAGPGAGIRRQPGGRFNTFNTPVRLLITFAYQIQTISWLADRTGLGTPATTSWRKMEGDPPSVRPGTGADHMMLATRTLLGERFKLKVHRETRELDIYALMLAKPDGKPGPALKTASGDCSPEAFAARRGAPPPAPGTGPVCGIQGLPGRIRFGGYPLAFFAQNISNQVGRAVVDRTGLTGNWDFEMKYAAPPPNGPLPPGVELPPSDPDAPDLFTAIREQLGLKLEAHERAGRGARNRQYRDGDRRLGAGSFWRVFTMPPITPIPTMTRAPAMIHT